MSFILGIDDSYGFVYEGISEYGAHLVWPMPVMTPAKFADSTSEKFDPAQSARVGDVTYYFREDLFDPVSRIRRGRFYKAVGSQANWTVMPNPFVHVPSSGAAKDRMERQTLWKFEPCPITSELGSISILGVGKATTIWRIIHIETSFTGEEMVTLKARQSMGALPEVDWRKVPPLAESNVREKLNVLEDDYRRAGAESVVDRAREAATAILSGYLQSIGEKEAKGRDLGALVALLVNSSKKDERRIVACAGEIPQRLHSRGKHAEHEKRNVRPIREQDAELAVQCIGVMLCDLGWAEWR